MADLNKQVTSAQSTGKRFLVGFLTIAIVMAIWPGGLGFLLISIICSGGMTLVIWLPLAYVVGLIVTSLFNFAKGGHNPDKVVATNGQHHVLNNDQLALLNYIKQAKANNMSNEVIASQLKNNGWAEVDINNAFKLFS